MSSRVFKRTIIAAVSVAAVFAVIFLWPRPTGPRPAQVSAKLRSIMTGMVAYAQSNGDAFPTPDQLRSALLARGLVPPEVFEVRGAPPNVVPFLAVVPQGAQGAWGNSFTRPRPVLIANPELWPGKQATAVEGSSGHGDWVEGAAFRQLMAEFGHQLRPIR